jgi:hypothetical protein
VPRDAADVAPQRAARSARYGVALLGTGTGVRQAGRGVGPASLPVLQAREQLLAVPAAQRRAVLLAEDGVQRLHSAGMTWESVAGWLGAPLDAQVWERLVGVMGYMALLRNLRNLDEAGAGDEVAQQVGAAERPRAGGGVPSAATAVPVRLPRRAEPALGTGTGGGVESLLRVVEHFGKLGGTETAAVVHAHYRRHDRVVIVTDEQAWSGWHGQEPTTAVPAHVPVYTWNVAGYRHGHGPSGTAHRHTFGGLSDGAFTAIPLLERGRDAAWPFRDAPSRTLAREGASCRAYRRRRDRRGTQTHGLNAHRAARL